MKKLDLLMLILMIGLAACNRVASEATVSDDGEGTPIAETASERPGGMGMGPGSSMMERHHAPIPDAYAGLSNPVRNDKASLERGGERYTTHCASCHGDGGMGDGPASVALDPAPAAIAHTSQMMGDDYLFYRISEGGAFEPFNSAMPRWKETLGEQDRWDLINYVRALGSGQVMAGQGMGGATFDPEAEAMRHEEMARQGVEQGVITQEGADTFLAVHAKLDALMMDEMERMGSMDDMQATMLARLVEEGHITREEADTFSEVHDGLMAAGLME
jgi:mono/diheme cytochrome c family protein